MKKEKKKQKGYLFLVPTFLCMFLMCILPLLFSLIRIGTIKNFAIKILILILVILFVIILLFTFLEAVFCVLDVYHNTKMKREKKLLWYFLLIFFNIFIVPYYYIENNKKFKNKKYNQFLKYFYIFIVLTFSILSIITTKILINTHKIVEEKEIKKKKIQESVRNIFSSNDEKIQMSFKLGFERTDVSEYDLYAKNEKKNLVTGVFLYDINGYAEKTPDAILDKQIEYFKNNKKNAVMYKEKEVNNVADKTIHSVLLKAENEDNNCIYKLSAISFSSNQNFIAYVIQVSLENQYDKYTEELNEILASLKLK